MMLKTYSRNWLTTEVSIDAFGRAAAKTIVPPVGPDDRGNIDDDAHGHSGV